MLFVRQSEKEGSCSANHAEIKLALQQKHIHEKGLGLKTIQIDCQHIKVMSVRKGDAGKESSIIQLMKMLNFDLRILKSSMKSLALGRKVARWTESIRWGIMNVETSVGPLSLNRQQIVCQEIIG